jgi:hypothetical protein
MTPELRKFLLLIAIGAVLFTILVTDTHRTAIASVWPSLMSLNDWLGIKPE